MGLITFSRWQVRGLKKRFFGPPSIVALGECPNYDVDLQTILRNLWNQAEMPNLQRKRILIKPNLIDHLENHPVTTSPKMVGAVADLVLELGAKEVIVGEGSGFRRETWPVALAIGLDAVLAERGLKFVDLNYDDPQPVPVKDGWIRRSSELWLPRDVLDRVFE